MDQLSGIYPSYWHQNHFCRSNRWIYHDAMTNQLRLALVDPNVHRRARVTYAFARHGRHIEPYDDEVDLVPPIQRSGVIIAYDIDDLIERVIITSGASASPVAVIAYSGNQDLRAMFKAIKAGAIDYVTYSDSELDLLEAVRCAELSLWNSKPQIDIRDLPRERIPGLTTRERQILEAVASGSTNREIADAFSISHRTVENHRANALRKLGARNSVEAVHKASEAGLIFSL